MKEKRGPGRVLAVELMVNNEAVSNLIRKGKAFQLPSVISTSREQGMQLMDFDLMRLTKEGKITAGDAYVKAVSKKDFEPFVEEEEKAAAQKRAPNFKTVAVAAVPTPAQPQPTAPAPATRPSAHPQAPAARPAAAGGTRKP
jgi:Tfp pilus assembly ATPase PilU